MTVASFDTIIVGAGLAGQMAAVTATRLGKRVAMVSEVPPTLTHSSNPRGVNVCLAPGDDWRNQAADIWNDGHFLADWDAVEAASKDGPQVVLDEFRDLLDEDEQGGIMAHDYAGTPRGVMSGQTAGLNFMRRLSSHLAGAKVPIVTERVVTSLVIDGGRCRGITAFNLLTGEMEGYQAANIILCSGGFGHLYQNTAHGPHMTGDGQALAYRAGVPIQDAEFVYMHHTLLYGTHYAITEGALTQGMRLFNRHNERFLEKYDPRLEDGTDRFLVKRYMTQELKAGNGIDGRYLHADFTHLSAEHINQELPRTRRGCLDQLGLDIMRDRVPITPGVYVTLGGTATDTQGRTILQGLLAAGECACTGLHGAEWRVGNTLLAALVFGRRAGLAAAESRGEGSNSGPIEHAVDREERRLQDIISRTQGEPYEIIRGTLRRMMTDDVALIRTGPELRNALQRVHDLQRRYATAVLPDLGLQFNRRLVDLLKLGNMLTLGELVINAALAREESRGGHYRADFPERDDAKWQRHSLQTFTPDGPKIDFQPVRLGEFELKREVALR